MNDLFFDTRFIKRPEDQKVRLGIFLETMTIQDLKDISTCAAKLQIDNWSTRPAVDVLYDIAGRLSILEPEIVSPESIMIKIREYLENN